MRVAGAGGKGKGEVTGGKAQEGRQGGAGVDWVLVTWTSRVAGRQETRNWTTRH